MALYLTYRPQTFDEVIGQDHIIKILKPKVEQTDTSHSNYLFYGPRGTGKTSTARIFAKAINCTNLQNGNPCNQCDNCRMISTGKTVDLVEIDAASHTNVDNIREEIIDKAPYPPSALKKKVYIIDEVHMLSKSAFNALLKIMEEPPEYLVFILATTEINKVPETIISRCQVFTFKKVPLVELMAHLQRICQKENIAYEEEAIKSIAKISDGCVRDAVKYVDQVSILGDITQEHVTSFLGVAGDQLISQFLQACLDKNINDAFAIIDQLHESGIDVGNFIKQSLVFIEEHFQENPTGYIACAEILKRISYGLKNFPLPTILMKMEVYNGLVGGGEGVADIAPAKTVATQSVVSQASVVPPQTVTKPAEATTTNSIPTVVAEKPPIQPQTDALTPTQTPVTDTASSSSDISVLQQIAHNPEIKTSIKTILLNSCILEHNEQANTLYVFNKLQTGLLQKPEIWMVIERLFKEITGVDTGLQIVSITKEDYLAQKL